MMIYDIPIWIWGVFLLFVLGMLALDLGVFHKEAHEVSIKEALIWSVIWISIALVFCTFIFFGWNFIQPNSVYSNAQAGQAFLAGYLVEKALSVDNIFVFLLVFSYFQVPAKYQHRVLFWGILGALIFRTAFIAVGAAVLERFLWTMILFGLFLIYTGIKMVKNEDKKLEPDNNPVVKVFRKMMPVTPDFVGQSFFTRIDGRLWATPLFVCLLVVEFTDIIFAVDSIPAIFAITDNPFIVWTSNIFAILGLRALFFAVGGLMKLFHYLHYGLAGILVFIGGKMLYHFYEKEGHEILNLPEVPKFPTAISLIVIIAILTISIVWSIKRPPKEPTH